MREKEATVEDLEELPPFHSAARHGDDGQLSHLLETHPDLVDYGDGKGFTALMHAVFAKNIGCAKLLLEHGSRAELKDSKGRTSLHFCARQGWSEGAELLMKFGAKCSTVDGNGRNTLHFGACSYEESCLEVLLKTVGLEIINAVDCEGMTPLHWASFHNIEENVNTLLEKGADAFVLDNEHKTPLHWAAQNGCIQVCNSLLRTEFCTSLINQKAKDSKTALHLAAIGGYMEVIFELAQGKGFDAEIGDKEGRTALHWACAVGSDRCVAGLLRLGVKHDAVDNYGITPLVYARQLKHETCVSLIGAFNPLRPQDVLIPVESFTKHSNTIEKISHHRASLSNVEQDVFMLVPSCEKDQSNLEKVLRLYENEESLANDHESQPIIVNHEDALNIEIRYSDCDSNWSDDELTSTSQAAHHDTIIDIILSDDEMRYQPQMSLTPPNSLLRAPLNHRRKKGEQKNGQNKNQKMVKKPMSPYQLAPIRSNLKNLRIESTHNNLNSPSERSSPRSFLSRKISTGALEQRKSMNYEKWINDSNGIGLTRRNDLSNRPVGLRRKSLSFNDVLESFNLRTPDETPISRTQSYVQMGMHKSKLPMIDVKNGRNLTQPIRLHEKGFVNDVFHEIEPVTMTEGKSVNKTKKRKKKNN